MELFFSLPSPRNDNSQHVSVSLSLVTLFKYFLILPTFSSFTYLQSPGGKLILDLSSAKSQNSSMLNIGGNAMLKGSLVVQTISSTLEEDALIPLLLVDGEM